MKTYTNWSLLLLVLHISSLWSFTFGYFTTAETRTNIALNQRASQAHNSTWNGWTWTADHAVDGCRLADNPDNQYCCSTSDDGWNLLNWWRVDFDQYYVIDEAVITGRSDTSNQLQGFTISYGNGGSSTKLYDANGTAYGSGMFTIPINPPVIADAIIIRRLGTLTLCEVEIYGVPDTTTAPATETLKESTSMPEPTTVLVTLPRQTNQTLVCKGSWDWNDPFTMKRVCTNTCLPDYDKCNLSYCVCEKETFKCTGVEDSDDVNMEWFCTSTCYHDYENCPKDKCVCNKNP